MSLKWMGQATKLKKERLWSEINKVENKTLRANMIHTWHKFLGFLDEDVERVRKHPTLHTETEVLEE